MPGSYRVCPDVLFAVAVAGVVASNHRARCHVWLSLPLLAALAETAVPGELRARDLTRFTSADGLLADPTGLDAGQDPDGVVFADLGEALAYLAARFIVVEDDATYDRHFAPKRSIVDRQHLGTFHQRLGAELRLGQRRDPAMWWYEQKFDPATGEVRPTLYRFVQEAFIERYVPTLDLKEKTVLDFGCGPGMASRRFVAAGARVIGVDPDPAMLERASHAIGEGFRPCRLVLTDPDPLAALPAEPVDLLWLADVFMFYFYDPEGRAPRMAPATLLQRLAARVRPGGRCIIMQPHGVFWLAPWLGDAARPYTVLTEYAARLYSVSPSLEELSAAIAEAGLAITRVYEPRPNPEGRNVDQRAYHFADNFPQWWVFECVRATDPQPTDRQTGGAS